MKSIKIPDVRLNELSITQDVDSVNIFYGINDEAQSIIAKAAIRQYIKDNNLYLTPGYGYDFTNNTHFGKREWLIDEEFNVFKNDETTTLTNVVTGTITGFEKVYWLYGKTNESE